MPEPVTQQDLIKLSKMPASRAVYWFRRKGYKISWDWRETWKDEHARAFTVAKASTDEVLRELRRGVDSAVAAGWSERRFIQEMTPRMKALGWWGQKQIINPAGNLQLVQFGSPWRLKTIYRTNMYTSFARGRYHTLAANIPNRPFWMYDAKDDSLTRPSHAALDNKVFRADSKVWDQIYPPNGFNCRCLVRALKKEQVEERGLLVDDNPRLPDGFPDKGWNFNPAKQTVEQLAKAVELKPKSVSVPDVPPATDGPPMWETFSSSGHFTNAKISEYLRSVPGARNQVKQLDRFLSKHNTGSVFVSYAETKPPWQRSSQYGRIEGALRAYLDSRSRDTRIYSRTGPRALGYTHRLWNHVVIRVKKAVRFKDVNPLAIPDAISDMFDRARSSPGWGFTDGVSASAQTGKDAEHLVVWLHEIGHQVHYKAGFPSPPISFREGATLYSRYNEREFFAEHFAAWVLNRGRMVNWNQELAEFFDEMVERAINAANSTRPGG